MSNTYEQMVGDLDPKGMAFIFDACRQMRMRLPQTPDPETKLAPLPPEFGEMTPNEMSFHLSQWARACGHGWTMHALVCTARDLAKDAYDEQYARTYSVYSGRGTTKATLVKERTIADPKVVEARRRWRQLEGLARTVEATAKSYDRNYQATSRQIGLAMAEMQTVGRA